jgi:hypothetical protein
MFAQEPSFLGAPVKTTASLKTGAVTWDFGTLTFTGHGVVTKID